MIALALAAALATGSVEIAPGRTVSWDYSFDRNAAKDAVLAGERLVVLTESGDLLSYSVPDLVPGAERIGEAGFTAIRRTRGGAILAAGRDGRVFAIAPDTLDETSTGRLDGEPVWVDATAAGLVAIVRDETKTFDELFKREMPAFSHRFVSPAGSWSLPQDPSTAYLDGAGRVWIGADHGEFGGWLARVDPGGAPRIVDGLDDPVLGFLERPDGSILAYVGGMHIVLCGSAVVRVDSSSPETIWSQPAQECTDEARSEPVGPGLPISWMGNAPDGGVWVLAYDQLFHVDSAFREWTLLRSGVPVRYVFGMPFAVGTPPSLVGVDVIDASGPVLISASRADGPVRWGTDGATIARIPGQIEPRFALEPVAGSSGIRVVESDPSGEGALWTREGEAWTRDEEAAYPTLWVESSGRVIGADRTSLVEITPERDEDVADLPLPDHPTLPLPRAVNPEDSPYYLAEPWTEELWRVDRDDAGTRVTEVKLGRTRVLDAAPWEDGALLIATPKGLRLFDPRKSRAKRAPIPDPPGVARSLARDGAGRLWAFADRAWVYEAGGWTSLDGVPFLRGSAVRAARPLADDPDAVIVTFESRGVAVLRLSASPSRRSP